jgi:glycosyltransferase involved in cell wall biosynthesis
MSTRILLLTQWFDPEPTFKGLVFARELVRQGFEVEVLTGFPNYPGGKIYPGYTLKWLQRERIDGILVTRVPLYPSHDQSAIRRVLNYVSFATSALLYGLLGAKKPDVIYAYHPPLTVGIVAVFIRFFRRIPVVYDIQDMWPDTLRATGMIANQRALALVAGVCDWVYDHVDHIVVLSAGFKRLLVERGVADRKVDVIYNWCDEASLSSPTGAVPAAFPSREKFRILFAGNMGKAQALGAVLDAAKLISLQCPQICFVFLGGGVVLESLKQDAIKDGLDNVYFLPAVPMTEVGNLLAEADALLVHLKNDPLFQITIPSKTQAYMAVGKPILMAVDGDAAELVKEGDCGVVAESQNPESIAAAAIELFNCDPSVRTAMGESSRDFYQQHLSLRVGAKRFGDIFRRLSGPVSKNGRSL